MSQPISRPYNNNHRLLPAHSYQCLLSASWPCQHPISAMLSEYLQPSHNTNIVGLTALFPCNPRPIPAYLSIPANAWCCPSYRRSPRMRALRSGWRDATPKFSPKNMSFVLSYCLFLFCRLCYPISAELKTISREDAHLMYPRYPRVVDTSDARPRGLWSSVRQISINTNGITEKSNMITQMT